MRWPAYVNDSFARVRTERLWGLAFLLALLMPLMFIVARVGMEICAVLIGLLFLRHSHLTRDWSWLKTPFMRASLLCWAWLVLVVAPLSIPQANGIGEALAWVRFPLLFPALRYWLLREEAAQRTFVSSLMILLSLVLIDCLFQLVTGTSLTGHAKVSVSGTDRLTGPFDGPKPGYFMGMLMLPIMGMALCAALRTGKKYGAITVLLMGAATLIGILLCGERTAFLISMLGAGTALGLLMLAERSMRRTGLVLSCIMLLALTVLYAASERVQQRVAQAIDVMQHYPQSDYGQLAIAGIHIGQEHLLHGGGMKSYRVLSPDMNYKGQFFRGLHPHNFYVEWFAETGLPGLLLFIVTILILLHEGLQHFVQSSGASRIIPAIAIGVLAQHFFPLIGSQSYFNNWSGMMQWFTLALAFAALPTQRA